MWCDSTNIERKKPIETRLQLTDPMIIILLVAAFISGVPVIPIVEIVKFIQRKLAK